MGAETPKQFLELDGSPILVHSLRKIASCELITDIIVATRADEVKKLDERLRAEKFRQTLRVIKGGDTRQESVSAALKYVAEGTEIVLVHDAVGMADIAGNADLWEKVIRKLESGTMPPKGMPRPDKADLDKLSSLLETTLDPGEAEAIALAMEMSADLILLDERDGRIAAERAGLRVTGLLGVLLRAKG